MNFMTEGLIKKILAEELFGTSIFESQEDREIVDFFYKKLLLEKFLWGEPISVPELRKLLRKKIVNFEFIKLDGYVRPARGTTNLKYIPKEDHPKGIRPASDAVATFYDLDKEAWRSVSKKSKEIVLKKDEEKDRPIVVVKDKEEGLKKKGKEIEKLGPEPPDEIHPGDIRNYLNRNGKNIVIRITRIGDDGKIYAETMREKTPFLIPAGRIQNIGEITEPPVYPTRKTEIPIENPPPEVQEEPEMRPVAPPKPAEGNTNILPLIPKIRPSSEIPPEGNEEENEEEPEE